ncbi:MAG: DUF3299 domain-containing protein [Pseudomonadota bacterium]
MKKFLRAVVTLSFALSDAPARAEVVAWDDLVDKEAQVYEDPYLDLAYDQIDDLRTVAMETARIENGELSDEQFAASEEKLELAGARLAEAGIDADWLIGQRWVVADRRKKAATAVNPEINGEIVSLGGFAIPAPPAEDGTQIVYLVPERGMCAHVPPPNPNQMIRARVSGDWSPNMMHEPVRLTGQLSAKETLHMFRIVDGEVPMQSSFIMEVAQVETLKDLQSNAEQTNAWAQKIADDLRASGHLPPKQEEPNE